jgi:hypothetical protein
MIIVQLKGGFGNQLFQYAAGLSLATHHGVEVKVDIDELQAADREIGTIRNYDLEQIIHPPLIASRQEIDAINKQCFVKKYYQKLLPPYKRQIYKEAAFTFDPNFFNASDHLYLKGYRQSEKYFSPIKNTIKLALFPSPVTYHHLQSLGNQLKSENSVSIHIRRGDYNNPVVQQVHGVLDAAYYNKAIDLVQQELTAPIFYIFSDDMDWVQDSVRLPANSHFVSGVHTSSHFHDFYLMSCCKHNIIANSSFSWWCAWFNGYPNKLVITPRQWFRTNVYDTSDIIPEGWLRI